ncbi:MAG: zf-HC2 domain-containing protein [Planctomycetota bacterium]|nr:zf-HC2 domain-containing protein [Planctomycetota bacterium]
MSQGTTPLPPDCDATRPLLSVHLDGELAGEQLAALTEHLAGCPACSAELAELRALGGELATEFADLRASAPQPPAAHLPRVAPRRMPRSLQLVAATLALLFAGAWLLDDSDAFLRERAAGLAAELALPGARFLVSNQPPESLGQSPAELAHLLVPGPLGAYLWQLAEQPEATSLDPTRYLLGSDGGSLWTWDPALREARTLPVDAVPAPLPRTLSQVLAALPAALASQPAEVRGRGAWREVEVFLAGGEQELDATRARVILTEAGELVGLEVLPRPDLAVFVRPLGAAPAPASFALLSHASVQGDAVLALEPPTSGQPDQLWQLGYTPGAPPTTWPEELRALATELGALGYLGDL